MIRVKYKKLKANDFFLFYLIQDLIHKIAFIQIALFALIIFPPNG